MASLTDYKGLSLVSPDPFGAGGLLVNDNFKFLADQRQLNQINDVNGFTTNDTTWETPSGLSFDVLDGEVWRFEVNLFGDLDAGADLEARINAPTNSTGRFSLFSPKSSACVSGNVNSATSALSVETTVGAEDLVRVIGIVEAAGDGTIYLRLRNGSGTADQVFSQYSFSVAQKMS